MSQAKTKTSLFTPETEMTIYTAETNKQELVTVLKSGCELVIDLKKIGEIDSAGVQILLLAHKECTRRNSPLQIVNPCDAVLDVLKLCNLTSLISQISTSTPTINARA